jgi:Sulfotransferase family/Glycosyl transferases group 1
MYRPASPTSSSTADGKSVQRDSVVERQLFIAGCPRSGTSALVFLLNEHPQLVIGFERFKRIRAHLDPFHFAPARFFSPLAVETDIRGERLYERLRTRWEDGRVTVIGDKVPLYTRVLPQLLKRFPDGRAIVLVRDPLAVASSFRRRASDPDDWWPAENDHELAVRMWNEALASAREVELGRDGSRLFLMPYEPLLAGDERWLEALTSFIGLPSSGPLLAEQRRLAAEWRARQGGRDSDPELVAYVDANRDDELLAWASERMAEQLEQLPALGARATDAEAGSRAGASESPADGQPWRELEREELLEEMRSPGSRRADEVELLERRLLEQAGELARRGERIRGVALAERSTQPHLDGRVTFILPHQRHTTGGVYAIEQFARHLAEHLEVSVLVRAGSTRPIAGVRMYAAVDLDAHTLPPGDVLLYPADMSDASRLYELPETVGRPVMFLQGYGTPSSPVVSANLDRAEEAVAIAHWLVYDALRHDAACTYVPYGLDRDVFAPGPFSRERPLRVSVMTHRLDWKGLDDALAAVSLVRSARADVEVVLFGVEPVEGVGTYLDSPDRAEVAALLRSSAVHIVSSWEEGFGLTGAEAIACGAALATTDTRGSRDYAIDGHTALVSPPRDPGALAENVLRLLADAKLRDRLVVKGQRHLRGVMPPWAEAARRLGYVLLG